MQRLSRAESQAMTRTRLLATATELFLRDGFAATSLDKIAEAAGFTKGALYGHFRNKDELCQAVLDGIRAQRIAEIADTLRADTLTGFQEWAERVIGDPAWTRLEMEFALQASRDEHTRELLAERLTGVIQLVGGMITDRAGLRAEHVATTLLGLGVGLGLFRLIQPTIPISPLVDLMASFLEDGEPAVDDEGGAGDVAAGGGGQEDQGGGELLRVADPPGR